MQNIETVRLNYCIKTSNQHDAKSLLVTSYFYHLYYHDSIRKKIFHKTILKVKSVHGNGKVYEFNIISFWLNIEIDVLICEDKSQYLKVFILI